VEAAAKAFSNVDNLTVLNGAQGIGEIMNQVIGQAGPALDLARHALGSQGHGRNGHPISADEKGASGN
jgi:flotillin